jgi:multimeric flavodoxin WrbA
MHGKGGVKSGERRAGNVRVPRARKGMRSVALSRAEFEARYRARFYDPAFQAVEEEVAKAVEVAWGAYREYRANPRQRTAGHGFADPELPLGVEWLAARKAVRDAQRRWKNPRSRSRILVVNGSSRSDQSCPGEMSKTYRLAELAIRTITRQRGFEADLLDLSRLTSEFGRVIYPCKACVSTAMPLCHWPCSCYPNHALGQVGDWMSEIYPLWVAAHGVLILTPVQWYQAPSVLKLMIDRLVCADGGNPDPTLTGWKDAALAKAVELRGWHYPKHLAGRAYGVVVHGDAAGVETLTRNLSDWLTDMHLVKAGREAELGRYVGYYAPYATSHEALDRDEGFQAEVRNAALSVVAMVRLLRNGDYRDPAEHLPSTREK